MDTSRLAGDPTIEPVKLACAYRLQDVVDARTSGDRVGGIGFKMFLFDDAVGFVRKQLASAGFVADNAPGEAVTIRIVKIYLAENNVTKIPVVVYDVHVGKGSPVLIRSQLATMHWANSQDEAYNAFGRAFQDANAKLILSLNERCAGRH